MHAGMEWQWHLGGKFLSVYAARFAKQDGGKFYTAQIGIWRVLLSVSFVSGEY